MDCLIICVYSLRCWNLKLHFLNVKPNLIIVWEVVWHTMFVFNETSTLQPLHWHWTFLICLMKPNTLLNIFWVDIKVHTIMSGRNTMLIGFMFKSIIYFKWTIFRIVFLCVIYMLNESKIDIPCAMVRMIAHA